MSKEQQINQITHLLHQNQQAYLLYCQQIITYLTVLNWLKTMYMVKESTIYNEKCTSEAEILSTESHQEIDDVKPLKHKEKPNLKTGLASESLYYQKDEDTGLYYANARYYDSETGRFLREDPFDGDVQTPPSLHRYLYANANPNFYTDPTGQFSLCGLAPRCFDGDDILSATQSQLARNDETLANNLQLAENMNSDSIGSSESDITGNASYRLLTEGLQGINNAAQFILDSTILASDSRNLTKAKAQAEVNIRKTEESVRNAVSFVAENKLKAGGILLKSTIEGFNNFRTNLYNASLGDAKAQADVLVTGTKIATAVVPASRLNITSGVVRKGLGRKVELKTIENNYVFFNKTHKNSLPKPKGKGPNNGRLQSHHGLQQQWAQENLSQLGYDASLAPTVTIETGKGLPHTIINNLQNVRRNNRVKVGKGKWDSSLQFELQNIVDDMKAAGFENTTINQVLQQQYNMLDKLNISYEKISN